MTEFRLTWRIGAGGMELRRNGDRLYRDAVVNWKGQEQVRDIEVRGDGTVVLGPDKNRSGGLPVDQSPADEAM